MEDHHYTVTLSDEYTNNTFTFIECMESSSEDVIEGKESDDFLIQLYKERSYLYDKTHEDFKNKQMKERAWFEISSIMQQKNLGKRYTPKYCQIRCTSLRDQYSREKRNIDNSKSESIASLRRKTFPFFTQLSFLDHFIKRRRTFSNVERNRHIHQSKDIETTHEKSSANESSDESEYEQQDTIKMSQKRNISACQIASKDMAKFEEDHIKHNIEISASKLKRRKIDQPKSIDETLTNISKALMNFLKNAKESTINNKKKIDQSFVDYIRVHLENIPEPEKTTRKKMIIDALTGPLPKT